MRLAKSLWVTLGSGLVVLTSCATSSSDYVEGTLGFAATRGNLIKVENLHFQKVQYLSDGVAFEVDEPGCRATFGFDKTRQQTFDLKPGDRLVLGEDFQAALQQHGTD